jgi:hypothetical protein
MTRRRTKWLAVVVGSLWLLLWAETRAPAQSGGPRPPSTEQIEVEAAVSFPYDI